MFKIFSCCRPKEEDQTDQPKDPKEPKREKDFTVKQSKAKYDQLIVKMEKPYMFLKEISFDYFASQLIDFTNHNATINYDSRKDNYISCNSQSYNEPLPEDLFQSFIENKVMKKDPLYTLFGKEEVKGNIFKEILLLAHKGLIIKMNQAYPSEEKGFKKGYGLALALLYCKGRNDDKLKFVFELFKENNQFAPSVKLDVFLAAMFFLASYCMIDSRFKITKKFSTVFNAIEIAVIKAIIDAYEVQDIQRLVKIYNSYLFPEGKKSYTYDELKMHFINENLGWIFYPKTIRYQLEINNDIK